MSRKYDTEEAIVLPMWKASECSTAAHAMVTAYDSVSAEVTALGKTLPESLGWAVEDLRGGVLALDSALAPEVPVDGQARKQADQVMDAAWSSFHGWLQATLTLPSSRVAGYEQLSSLNQLVFSEGLSFVQTTYEEEWHATSTRLTGMVPYESAVVSAGGGLFLEGLKEAFVAYGEALGITKEKAGTAPSEVRARKGEVETVLRRYVARIVGWPDSRLPEAGELAERLLQPLTEWK